MTTYCEVHAPSLVALMKAMAVMLPLKSEKRDYLKRVNIVVRGNTMRLEASNGQCIAKGELTITNIHGDFTISIPSEKVIEISKLKVRGYCSLSVNETIEFVFSGATVKSNLVDADFPDLSCYYRNVPIKPVADVGIDWRYLELVIKAAKAIKGRYTGVSMACTSGEIRFRLPCSNDDFVDILSPLLIIVMPMRI